MQEVEEGVPPVTGGLLDLLLSRPAEVSRLPVGSLSREQEAAELQRVAALEARTAAYEAELVLGLADVSPGDLAQHPPTRSTAPRPADRVPLVSAPGPLPSAIRTWVARGPDEHAAALTRRLADEAGLRTVVLVEGVSDGAAVAAAAARQGRHLAAEGVCVVPMGGATGIRRYLRLLGPDGLGVRVAGLYDVAEEPLFLRAWAEHGHGPAPFAACVADLEEELIRSVGVAGVEEVVRALHEERALATFRNQPAHRGRPPEQQLHRFLGTTSGRKARYAQALAERLDPSSLPAPLARLLAST